MKTRILAGIVLASMQIAISQAQVLNVSRIMQTQNQWCWAGVSACVLEFYGKPVTQCEIAEYTRTHEQFSDIGFGSKNCCESPSTCNMWNYNWGGPGSIEDILLHFANIPNNKLTTYISKDEITALIQANRLFIVRWGLTTGGGHFVVGHGISGDNIYYMNPWPGEGKKIGTYTWMITGADHSWTHTNTCTVSAQLPASTGAVSGPLSVCQGSNDVVYRVPPVDRALKYNWTFPAGVTGRSTADSIALDFASDAVSGDITVTPENNLGTGTPSKLAVTVNPLPAPAGPITGSTQVCQRQRQVTYTVPEIPGASSYSWTVNADATGSSTSNRLTLDFGFRTGDGTITVKGLNGCGPGQEYTLNIHLGAIPDPPFITQNGNTLTSSSPVGNQWFNADGPIEGAVDQRYTITGTGDYYVIVSIDGCVSDPSETMHVILNGINDRTHDSGIRIFPNPVREVLHVDAGVLAGPVTIRIINALGQTVHHSILTGMADIDTGHYPPGLYLIRAESGRNSFICKFIRE